MNKEDKPQKKRGRRSSFIPVIHNEEFIIWNNELYSTLEKECLVYKDKVYYRRPKAHQVRLNGTIRSAQSLFNRMQDDSINIISPDMVSYHFPLS